MAGVNDRDLSGGQVQRIKLRTSNLAVIEVNADIVRCSLLILSKLAAMDSEDEEKLVDLPEIDSVILEKVIEWATFHKLCKQDTESEAKTDKLNAFDENFLMVDPGTLFEIVLAAEYLDIKGLLDISCKRVVGMIKGKSVEEIRESFQVRNDFTKEEEELVRKENEWCQNK